jgi:hypothetical protein
MGRLCHLCQSFDVKIFANCQAVSTARLKIVTSLQTHRHTRTTALVERYEYKGGPLRLRGNGAIAYRNLHVSCQDVRGRVTSKCALFRIVYMVCDLHSYAIWPVQNEVSAEGSLLRNRVLYREYLMYIFYMGNLKYTFSNVAPPCVGRGSGGSCVHSRRAQLNLGIAMYTCRERHEERGPSREICTKSFTVFN